ncbi:hypothetical protein V5D56_00435 [Cellulosimicrobium sp. PMB13]|uniref:hypothetical protein n=1 Tax=Cellulosimicrobium sp. PMB13 TaxID=3120158 RepID=UPI003F4C7EBF
MVALAVGFLTSCTGSTGAGSGPDAAPPVETSGTETSDAQAPDAGGSGPAGAGEDHAEHGDHAQHGGQVPVGPLTLPAAEYWSVIQPDDGVTQVRAGGCPEDAVCPSFDILTGPALDGVDPASAHVPDDATCPGADALAARPVAAAEESEAVVGGTPATLTRWTLSCVDGTGAEVRTADQLQWYVGDAPGGPVLVVDRWAFEGLGSRLAAGSWPAG